jgi:archaellum component FlaF (FlaF/FlaG flagellin family)
MAMLFENKITLGQCIQIITTLAGVGWLYVGMSNSLTSMDVRVTALEEARRVSDRQLREDMDKVSLKIDELSSKVSGITVSVARVEVAVGVAQIKAP